jgi:tetratricopeptide (TPR) repeat protein
MLRIPNALPTKDASENLVSAQQLRIPGKASNEYGKAVSDFRKNDFSGAKIHLQRALTYHSVYGEALALRGVIEIIENDRARALATLKEAVQVDPNLPTAYFAMAKIFNDAGDFSSAGQNVARGLSLSPESWQGHFEAARAQLGQKQFDAALREILQAEKLVPQIPAQFILAKALALIGTGQKTIAADLLHKLLNSEPASTQAATARQILAEIMP